MINSEFLKRQKLCYRCLPLQVSIYEMLMSKDRPIKIGEVCDKCGNTNIEEIK